MRKIVRNGRKIEMKLRDFKSFFGVSYMTLSKFLRFELKKGVRLFGNSKFRSFDNFGVNHTPM